MLHGVECHMELSATRSKETRDGGNTSWIHGFILRIHITL